MEEPSESGQGERDALHDKQLACTASSAINTTWRLLLLRSVTGIHACSGFHLSRGLESRCAIADPSCSEPFCAFAAGAMHEGDGTSGTHPRPARRQEPLQARGPDAATGSGRRPGKEPAQISTDTESTESEDGAARNEEALQQEQPQQVRSGPGERDHGITRSLLANIALSLSHTPC